MNSTTAGHTLSTPSESTTTPFRLTEYSMHTLRATLKELQKDVIRKLTTPLFKYFMNLYKQARDEVVAGTAPWTGEFGDLRWYQEKLSAIPKWNTEQIKIETHKIMNDLPEWPASDIVATVFYIKAMILASIRPSDMKDDVYIPIASIETYIHTCMRIIAKHLFGHPSIVRKFPDDDEDFIAQNLEKLNSYIESGIRDAITDLTPTAEIVQKYVKQVLQNVRRENTQPREMDESEKYGFEEPINPDTGASGSATVHRRRRSHEEDDVDDDLSAVSEESASSDEYDEDEDTDEYDDLSAEETHTETKERHGRSRNPRPDERKSDEKIDIGSIAKDTVPLLSPSKPAAVPSAAAKKKHR